VGKIIAQGRDVNLAQIRAGMAWWYHKYKDEQSLVDQGLYAAAELKARNGKVGLWADKEMVPPWEWRKH
jgi:endonuclease YncB( thermonuclease family)